MGLYITILTIINHYFTIINHINQPLLTIISPLIINHINQPLLTIISPFLTIISPLLTILTNHYFAKNRRSSPPPHRGTPPHRGVSSARRASPPGDARQNWALTLHEINIYMYIYIYMCVYIYVQFSIDLDI